MNKTYMYIYIYIQPPTSENLPSGCAVLWSPDGLHELLLTLCEVDEALLCQALRQTQEAGAKEALDLLRRGRGSTWIERVKTCSPRPCSPWFPTANDEERR